jgi:type IV pilus assembly protein PilV
MHTRALSMIAATRQYGPRPRISRTSATFRSSEGLSGQAGSMLLESFIAILIFSMGILAIVGMQASAVKSSADAKYRSEASLLVNDLLGQMWASDRTAMDPLNAANLVLQTQFQGGQGTNGPGYTAWYASFTDATPGPNSLPGSSAFPPTVTVVSKPGTTQGLVTVTVFWKAPNEPATAAAHSYSVIAQIK